LLQPNKNQDTVQYGTEPGPVLLDTVQYGTEPGPVLLDTVQYGTEPGPVLPDTLQYRIWLPAKGYREKMNLL
jgi:hypothetical protein